MNFRFVFFFKICLLIVNECIEFWIRSGGVGFRSSKKVDVLSRGFYIKVYGISGVRSFNSFWNRI